MPHDAAFDAQQRLIVVGQADGDRMVACRFMLSGALDETFGVDATAGCITQFFPEAESWASAVAIQTCPEPASCVDGQRIVVAGGIVGHNIERGIVLAWRLDGSELDTDFGIDGTAQALGALEPEPHWFTAVATNTAGGLIVVGTRDGDIQSGKDMIALRLAPEGTFHTDFDNDGYAAFAFNLGSAGFRNDHANAVWLGEDGSAVIAGAAQTAALTHLPAAVRVTPAGIGDATFDGSKSASDGSLYYELCADPCDMRATGVLVPDGGEVLLTGGMAAGLQGDSASTLRRRKNFFALRLSSSGAQDSTFRSPGMELDGLSIVDFGGIDGDSEDFASSAIVQGGQLVLAGYASATDPIIDDEVPDRLDFAAARIGNGHFIFIDGFESP